MPADELIKNVREVSTTSLYSRSNKDLPKSYIYKFIILWLRISLYIFPDDTRKIAIPDSSMMGRPDLQPQPVKVRMRKTRPERNRKDEI